MERCANSEALTRYENEQEQAENAREAFEYDLEASKIWTRLEELKEEYESISSKFELYEMPTFTEWIQEND